MIAVAFAALSGMAYGASDFSGALASKENDSVLVTAAMQVVSLLALGVVLVVFPFGQMTVGDLAWGGAAGLGAALGLTTFYRALAIGPMSTAASITALCSASIPVIYGLLRGIIPGTLTLIGIGLAVPAAVLVSVGGIALHAMSPDIPVRERIGLKRGTSQTRMLSVLAGFGFAWFFVALSNTSDEAGLYPLLGARAASLAALGVILTFRGLWAPVGRSAWWPVVLAGLLDLVANSSYLLALEGDNFTWVAALGSLYPVSTVLLARVVLKEHLAGLQVVGLMMAAGALVFVAVGQ